MRTIEISGKQYSRTVLKNGIVRMYDLTTEEDRFDWYGYAHGYAKGLASAELGVSLNQSIGVIAALSPRMKWEMNKRVAYDVIATGDCKAMGVFKQKAIDIIALDDPSDEAVLAVLSGPKIRSFYLNIKYPEDVSNVTIDRHSLSIALGYWIGEKEHSQLTPKKYQFLVEAYILAAHQLGISPVLLQSSVWTRFRQIKKQYKLK